jgi:hypothetical protein
MWGGSDNDTARGESQIHSRMIFDMLQVQIQSTASLT